MSALSGQRIGFIGLGLMGEPMACNLHAAGAAMVVHNRSPAAMARLHALGMAQAASPAELARACDSVVLMLTDTPAVEQVVAGPGGVLDMSQALALAAQLGLELPATALNRDLYQRAIDAGFGALDHSALVRIIDPER